ncbi:kinase-like domain-containing protein [Chiua virens]|nr:kinase-like domain-containing protein [Chiua virens]
MTLSDFSGQPISHYRITSPVSSGATSSVYGAVDTERPGKYAIKCISKSQLTPKQLLRRTSEVFHHTLVSGCPHVQPLQEIIDEDTYMFLVTELCGGDLYQAIWGYRIFLRNDALVKETFLDILDGVYACHQIGVFHRDLKPENILCTEAGTDIHIADFGLATRKRICRGSRCGSPDYMSPGKSSPCVSLAAAHVLPEQWTEDDSEIVYYPALADIWSLGIILINLVTGRRPWNTARVSDIHFRAFLEDKDYLYCTLPISRPLNKLLECILCPNPVDRLQILQIRKAISSMDTFYRVPGQSSDNTALGWSKKAPLLR